MTSRVSFNLVTWNGARYLPDLFASLENRTLKDMAIRIVDNASDDGTMDLLRHLPNATVIRNARNLGFAAAHNQAIRLSLDKWAGEDLSRCYVIVANQDVVLTPECLERLALSLEADRSAGSAQGKILRAFLEHPEDDYLAQTICADRVDSTGLRPSRLPRRTG
ncbi:MAG: Glycosyl transferase family protein [Candidatus Uhrbacteria bacterium GW2011_GWC2_53_7]|uniref:Glycosyl transferase family protein n=1 Tax=Candidatus Uhrbacteria bacterium GW2011_GWC2_53_7 TaxID=1618986 RepID=A0A0G1XU69_9BACT|nr:MAG: Glycosyl transferase family protein [Candidatus Uhrbacteria bacterium GW2011_GWC2_53_7]